MGIWEFDIKNLVSPPPEEVPPGDESQPGKEGDDPQPGQPGKEGDDPQPGQPGKEGDDPQPGKEDNGDKKGDWKPEVGEKVKDESTGEEGTVVEKDDQNRKAKVKMDGTGETKEIDYDDLSPGDEGKEEEETFKPGDRVVDTMTGEVGIVVEVDLEGNLVDVDWYEEGEIPEDMQGIPEY